MSNPKSPAPPPPSLYEVLENMEQELPLEPEEQDALLRDAHYDVEAGFSEVIALFDRADADAKRAKLHADAARNLAALGKVAAAVVKRSREENLQLIRSLLDRLPAGTPQLAYFRSFESVSDADLDSLLADLQALAPRE